MALVGHISGSLQSNSVIGISGSVIVANQPNASFPTFPGSDISFYVSGSTNGRSEGSNVSVFGGQLVVSGASYLEGGLYTTAISGSGNLDVGGDLTVAGDIRINGNDIKSSTGQTAITLNDTSVIIPGDLTINGTTVTVNTTNLEVKDALIGLGFSSGSIAEANGDRGFIGGLSSGDDVSMFWDNSASEFAVVKTNSTPGNTSVNITSYAQFHALGLTGSLTKLSDGTTDYLAGGSNISLTTGSNGQVTIDVIGLSGYVVGPASATNDAIAVYDGTTGKLIKNSGLSVGLGTSTQAYVTASVSLINYGLALIPDGTGSLSAHRPDGLSTGGNSRGANSVDFQMSRFLSSQVASGARSVIAGGERNTASGLVSVVVGGRNNTAGSSYSFIGAGDNNSTSGGSNSFIGGGSYNTTVGVSSVVCGGEFNTSTGTRSFVGGGQYNTGSGAYSSINGGVNNIAANQYTHVGGGQDNNILGTIFTSDWSFIGGGRNNKIQNDAVLVYNPQDSAIVGGRNNLITTAQSVIVGGQYNTGSGIQSFIGGGSNNEIKNALFSPTLSFIGGGVRNFVNSSYSSVVGGQGNIASGSFSTIGGGQYNTGSGVYSSVVGGLNNTAQSYGETSLGLYSTIGNGNPTSYVSTDRLLSVGNGTSISSRSNALTLIKNGDLHLSGTLTLMSGSTTGITFPSTRGINGQVLTSDGAGLITWQTPVSQPSYFTSTTAGSIYTTGSAAFIGNEVGIDAPSDKGLDVSFYVSGSTDGSSIALFGGNVVTSGSLNVLGNTTLGDTTTDTITFNARSVTSILPANDNQYDLGSATNRWANVYTGDLHLRNDRGDWTVIEEDEYLSIRNNKTGKLYKFVMEPVGE